MKWIMIYLGMVNIITVAVYGADKRKAVKGKSRVSESSLMLLAVIGGSAGALLGMHMFHHKTRKKKFTMGVPLILVLQIAACIFIWYRLSAALY